MRTARYFIFSGALIFLLSPDLFPNGGKKHSSLFEEVAHSLGLSSAGFAGILLILIILMAYLIVYMIKKSHKL